MSDIGYQISAIYPGFPLYLAPHSVRYPCRSHLVGVPFFCGDHL